MTDKRIDTAPKDGTEILVGNPTAWSFTPAVWDNQAKGWKLTEDNLVVTKENHYPATHWKPLSKNKKG